ncbi:hypothetical protein D6D00_08865 [Aureobasidium pullulans]|nr:hypothetical protein D6D00_08865 [Aureobasidium pullulans]
MIKPDGVFSPNDENSYTFGEMAGHNVVIAVRSGSEYGPSGAVAMSMISSFPNIKVGLMVGIGGGAPSASHDIRLGDVVVSVPNRNSGGVFPYDQGIAIKGQRFQQRGHLNSPPSIVLEAVSHLRTRYILDGHRLKENIEALLVRMPRLRKKFRRPSSETDRLYNSHVIHPPGEEGDCKELCGNEATDVVQRHERDEYDDFPAIHYGTIASGNRMIKDAKMRDALAKEYEVLCFDMEAAGVMNVMPCLVVRGICGYADTHIGHEWQGYAALTAAAYAKEVLATMSPELLSSPELATMWSLQRLHEDVQIDEADKNFILNWLAPIDNGPEQAGVIGMPDLSSLLLRSELFQNWLVKERQNLYFPEALDRHQSYLAPNIIAYLRNRFLQDPTVSIADFYCKSDDLHTQTPENLLAGLLKRLVQDLEDLPRAVSKLYDAHKTQHTRPVVYELLTTIQKVLKHTSRAFIIIDALDDYKSTSIINGRESFLTALLELQSRATLNILVTSKFTSKIQTAFEKHTRLELSADVGGMSGYMRDSILPSSNGKTESVTSMGDSGYGTHSYQGSRDPTGTALSSVLANAHPEKLRSLEIPTFSMAEGKAAHYNDTESVASLDDVISSLAESSSPYILQRIASECFTEALGQDTEISALYQQSCSGPHAMEREKFLRNHVRLLEAFFLDVSHETYDPLSKEATRVVRSSKRRRQISALIYQRTASTTTLQLDIEDRDDSLRKVEDYLSKYAPDEAEPMIQEVENEDGDFAFDEDSEEDSEDEGPKYPNFEAATIFLTSSRAFVTYKSRLRRFAAGLPQPDEAFERALDDEALEEATALLEQEHFAILGSKQHRHLRHHLDMGLHAREVVALVVENRSWEAADKDWRTLWTHLGTWFSARTLRVLMVGSNISDAAKKLGFSSFANEAFELYLRISRLDRLIAKKCRPAILEGFSRIEWTCICGKILFDDFPCQPTASLRAVQDLLTSVSITPVITTSANQGPGGSAPIELNSLNSHTDATSPPDNTDSTLSLASNQDSQVSKAGTATDKTNLTNTEPRHRRLYLCAKSGNLTLSVREIDASSMRSDFDLFAKIQEEYQAIRKCVQTKSLETKRPFEQALGWFQSIRFTRPGKAFFVKVGKAIAKHSLMLWRLTAVQFRRMHDSPKYGTLVEVIVKPSIPPAPPTNHGYSYKPDPLDPEIPMSTNNFIHFLRQPEEVHRKSFVWGPRFPRATGNSLLSSPDGILPIGWGIELVEEPNRELIFTLFVTYTAVVVCLMVVWAVLAKDKASFATYVGNVIALIGIPWGAVLASVVAFKG